MVDSDLDWGQDMNRLADFLSRAKAKQLAFTPFNRTYATKAGHVLPPITPVDPERPLPGWNAVSLTIWKLYGIPHWADHPPRTLWRVGDSILLWYCPEESGGEGGIRTPGRL